MRSRLRVRPIAPRRFARGIRCRGFTLFELVIVIAIVGALAALVAPRLTELPRRTTPPVVSFLEAERSKTVETGKATEIRLVEDTLTSSASGARLELGEGNSVRPIRPVASEYMPSLKLTELYADGSMRASSFRVISATSAYTVEISPFAPRIRYAQAE